MVSKKLALKLIQELEDLEDGSVRLMMEENDPLVKWMQRLVEEHPVFQDLPEDVRSMLVAKPKVSNLCGNRRRRKLWRREGGAMVYLYSGEKSGYTYERAVKDRVGGRSSWDMVNGKVHEELRSSF